jgi:hypothetical protein
MKTIIHLDGFICIDEFSGKYRYTAIKMDEYGDVTVCPFKRTLEVDIPDDFNPVLAKVAAIDEQIEVVRAKANNDLARLNDAKARLLCLENGAAT